MTHDEAVCAVGGVLWADIVDMGLVQGDTSSVTANRAKAEAEAELAEELGLHVSPEEAAGFIAGCLCESSVEGHSWDEWDAAVGRAIELLLRAEDEPELADQVWRARP